MRYNKEMKTYMGTIPEHLCLNNAFLFDRARAFLEVNKYIGVPEPASADLIILNTCGYTDELIGENLRHIDDLITRFPEKQFLVFGCLAKLAPELAQQPNIQLIGPKETDRFSEMFECDVAYRDIFTPFLQPEEHLDINSNTPNIVVISQGCTNSCAYCNIKRAKGDVESKPAERILAEITRVIGMTGQYDVLMSSDDCGSYGVDIGTDIAVLTNKIIALDSRIRIKYYNMHPAHFLKYYPQLKSMLSRVSFINIPIQSGSQRIVTLMNRHYDLERVSEVISDVRRINPSIVLYSHFIANFPTETVPEFEKSLEYAALFDYCFFLGYNENKRTAAVDIYPKCTAAQLLEKYRMFTEMEQAGLIRGMFLNKPSEGISG